MPRLFTPKILAKTLIFITFLYIIIKFLTKKELKRNNPVNEVEEMMYNNMLRFQEKQLNDLTDEEIKRLPNPKEVIKIAKGPLEKRDVKDQEEILEKLSQTLKNEQCSQFKQQSDNLILLLGHPGSGLEHLASWLHYNFGLFILHQDQFHSENEALYVLENLSKCSVINHSNKTSEASKWNTLFSCPEDCQTSPSLWSLLCQEMNDQALAFEDFSMSAISRIFKGHHPKVQALYVYRDPRAMIDPLEDDLEKEAFEVCEKLRHDLHEIDQNEFERSKIQMIRFEDFALNPNEMALDLGLTQFCFAKDFQDEFKSHVDEWKLKFSMEKLNKIEDKCLLVLNRLEYPIYGSNN